MITYLKIWFFENHVGFILFIYIITVYQIYAIQCDQQTANVKIPTCLKEFTLSSL